MALKLRTSLSRDIRFMLKNWSFSISPRTTIGILLLPLLILQQGCATTPIESWQSRLPEYTRSQILTVDIVVSEALPRITLDLPSKGAASGAGRKTHKWVGNWLIAAGATCSGGSYGCAVGLAMLAVTPLIAGMAALSGAVEAPSTETVESQETQVQAVLQAQIERLIGEFERQIVGHITSQTDVVPTLLSRTEIPKTGYSERGRGLSDDMQRMFGSGMNQIGEGKTDTKPKIDARLGIVLKTLELRGPDDVDPPLALQLEADITLSRYGTGVYSRTFRYETGRQHLTKWLADDATPLREAVGTSLSRLAELIVDDVFLTYSFYHEHPWRNPSSSVKN